MFRKLALCLTVSTLGILSATVVAYGSRTASAADEPPRVGGRSSGVVGLDLGSTIERFLSRGEDHRYQIGLIRGEYARVVVDQQGLDVIVRVRAADGHVVAEFNDEIRARGEECVELVAEATGVYSISVEPRPDALVSAPYVIRVADRRVATDADRSLYEARRLRTSAAALDDDGRFAPAAAQLERALMLTEQVRGADDVQVAAVASQLAGVYRTLPNNPRSEKLFERAVAILDESLGADHPLTAVTRSRLAMLYQNTGQRVRAEALLDRALADIEKTLGADNRWFVSALVTLANLRSDANDLDEDEAILRRAQTILEKNGDTHSYLGATLQINMGEIARRRADYAQAERFYKCALALGEEALGRDNYFLATPLQNLGIVARERKDYETAEAYYSRALAIRERRVGTEHPDIAQVLNNLAIIYRLNGDPQRSLATHLRALHIWEHAAGPYQQATLLSVGNIARTYAAMGDLPNALAYQRRVDALVEKQLELNLAVGSERQKLTFLRSMAERTDRTLSLHLDQAPHDVDAARLATLVLLQRKGRVLDAMTDAFAAMRQRVPDAGDRALMDQLKAVTALLARVALSPPDDAAELRELTIRDFESRKERLETALSQHSAAFRTQMQPVSLEAVQTAIPDNAALLEFAIFRPFDPRAERNAEAYRAPHYAAYVLRKRGAPRGVDLGDACAIDDRIELLRETLRDPKRTDLRQHARVLDELVMQPVRKMLGEDAVRLLISPDGDLNLVPFEALVDERGKYLVERYAMSYLTSGRDLLRMQALPPSRSAAVIIADPLFGEPGAPPMYAKRDEAARPSGRGLAADERTPVYFAPLAATAEEARAIKALFPEARVFTGRHATKAALQQVDAPRMLHIASHGFFLEDGSAGLRAPAASTGEPSRTRTGSVDVGNPLLRSGLALAGANLESGAQGDGILTALEASGLNLWGTRLVTLSACDTGVGEVRNGEGVYGLRRAFVLAGTETVVMSLWPVSDTIARETMVAYYTGLRGGLGRGDALRQAKLALLKRKNREHPFYWASFIQSGDWTSLNSR